MFRVLVFRLVVGYLVLERSGVCGLAVGWETKRVLSDGILILGFGFWGLPLVGRVLGSAIRGQPESLILAQNERWRHA